VHGDAYRDGKWPEVQAKLSGTPSLRLVHSDRADRVYAVLPAKQ